MDMDDDEDEDDIPVKKPAPVRDSVASRASENIRETVSEPVKQPEAPPKVESPKEERKSIAQLAALINPNAMGGYKAPGSSSGPPRRPNV